MAIAFGSAGTQPGNSNSTTIAVPVPSGVTFNDIIIVTMYVEDTEAVTPPSGFTAAPNSPVVNAAAGLYAHNLHIFWKRATAADSGTYSFTIAAGLSWRQAHATRFTGVITYGNPFDVTNSAAQTSTSGSAVPAVSVTTTGTNRMLIWCASMSVSSGTAVPTVPSGFTQRNSSTANNGLVLADLAQASAGSSGSLTGSFSGAGNGATTAWLGALIPDTTTYGISYVSSATAQANTIASMPTHQDGDLLIIFAQRNNVTPASVPGAWTPWPVTSSGAGTGGSVIAGYVIATAGSVTSGTWTNAQRLTCVVYRGALPGAISWQVTASGTTVNFPALTLSVGAGTSWTGRYGGTIPNNAGITSLNPSNAPNAAARSRVSAATGGAAGVWDNNAATGTNPTAGTMTVATGGVSIGATFELVALSRGSSGSSNTASAEAATLTLPTHATGDLILMYAFRDGNVTAPTIPGGWTQLTATSGTLSSAVLAYKVAASNAETSGTWTNATALSCVVKSGWYVGVASANSGVSATVGYPALTLRNTDGTSKVVAFGAHRSPIGTMATAPTGMAVSNNLEGFSQDVASFETTSGVTSWSSQNVVTNEESLGYLTAAVEIRPNPAAGTVTFDAFSNNTNNFGSSLSWSHTATAGTFVVLDVVAQGITPTAVTYAGTPMFFIASTMSGQHRRYGFANAPGGASTISITYSGSSGSIATASSWFNVDSVAVSQTMNFSGLTDSQSVTSTTGERIVQTFSAYNSSASTSFFSGLSGGTNRYNNHDGNRVGIATNDALTSTTFSATLEPSYASGAGGIATVLRPAVSGTIITGAVGVGVVNQNGSTSVTVSAGDSILAFTTADRDVRAVLDIDGVAGSLPRIGMIQFVGSSGNGWLAAYLSQPLTAGSRTVNFSGGFWININAIAYSNVTGVQGLPKFVSGTSGNASQVVAAPASSNNKIVQAFGVGNNTASLIFPSGGINRYIKTDWSSQTISDTMVATTFGVEKSSAMEWAGVAVELATAVSPTRLRWVWERGWIASSETIGSGSFSYTADAGDTVIVDIVVDRTATLTAVTYGGVAMTQLAQFNFTAVDAGAIAARYIIQNAPGGAQTVACTTTFSWTMMAATSIRGVGTVGATTTTSGLSTTPSHAVTASNGQLIVQSFFAGTAQVVRARGGVQIGVSGSQTSMVTQLSDASTTFTAPTSQNWASIATVFDGANPGQFFSMFW